jgi:hypothetical protein
MEETKVGCSNKDCPHSAPEWLVVTGVTGSMWGGWWFCDDCTEAMNKQLEKDNG